MNFRLILWLPAAGMLMAGSGAWAISGYHPPLVHPMKHGNAAKPAAATSKPPAPPLLVGLHLEPASIQLTGPDSRQHVVVMAEYKDGTEEDVTLQAKMSIWPEHRVVWTAPAVLAPTADGSARMRVRFGGQDAVVSIAVTDSNHRAPASFMNDIEPLLTKVGCNQGACHGSASGQNGFKLSLKGFDPTFDYEQIVKSDGGRRVDLQHPAQSLVFQKPSGLLPHGGGLRLPENSYGRALMLRWLKEGAPAPEDKVTITDLNVYPTKRVLARPGLTQQILVTARYSDGTSRDVTSLARFTPNDDSIAGVSETGLVTTKNVGETSIMVTYGGLVQAPRMLVPVGQTPVLRSEFPSDNPVDNAVFERLALLRIHPSALCTDGEFIRRATLDITGLLPTRSETEAFGQDTTVDKRARLIDALLARPQYVDVQTLRLADLFRVNSNALRPEGAQCFYQWIHDQVEANTPWNELARDVLLGRGPNYQSGPANYYRTATNPPDLAEATAQTFLGIRMQCARCHNHPFEKWTQNDYYGLAAYFARVGRKAGPEKDELQIFVANAGEVKHPRTNKVMAPHPLGDSSPTLADGEDRRQALADWLTGTNNLAFAQESVNRIWAEFMGRGIIDPVDDVRVSNPASNQKLLDVLTREYIRHGYDNKWLIRLIANSRTYQLSSDPTPTNLLDAKHFARALPRRLSAEQMLDAVDTVTGRMDRFGSMPVGTLAMQVPDSRTGNYFLDLFGKPKREILCACERNMQPNLSQSLHMINGADIEYKLSADDGWLHKAIKMGMKDTDIINDLYLRAVSRTATPEEMQIALFHIQPQRANLQSLHPAAPAAGVAGGPAKSPAGKSGPGAGGLQKGRLSQIGGKAATPSSKGNGTAGGSMGGAMSGSMDAGSMDNAGMAGGGMAGGGMNAGSMDGGSMNGGGMSGGSMGGAGGSSGGGRDAHGTPQARTAALEDIAWAVLNSQEFLFNH